VGGRHGWRRGTGTSTDGDRDGTDDRDARKPRDERRRGDEKANARERARAPSFPRAARRVESTRLVDAMIPIDGCVTMNGCESKNARGRRTSVVGAVHTFPVGRGTARRRRADARRRGSHLRFQARTRSIVRHHRWIYTGIARHRELRMPRRSHSFVFSLGRATVRLLVRDDVASDSDDATRNQVNTHRARARVVARAPCLYARLRVRPLEPTSRRRELLVPRIGVLEIPYQDFPGTYQRTSTVPAECPNAAIVWVNSIDQLVQAGTSWYELVRAGTEVTHRREPRENRRTSRCKSIYWYLLIQSSTFLFLLTL